MRSAEPFLLFENMIQRMKFSEKSEHGNSDFFRYRVGVFPFVKAMRHCLSVQYFLPEHFCAEREFFIGSGIY